MSPAVRRARGRRSGAPGVHAQFRLGDDQVVGCTAYWDPRPWAGRSALAAIEVGFTWLAASAQGTGINAEAKLLLFRHAFEHLGAARVDLKTRCSKRTVPSGDSGPGGPL